MQFFHILPAVMTLPQRKGQVTYQSIKLEFGRDDMFLDGIRAELIDAKRCAVDEDNPYRSRPPIRAAKALLEALAP